MFRWYKMWVLISSTGKVISHWIKDLGSNHIILKKKINKKKAHWYPIVMVTIIMKLAPVNINDASKKNPPPPPPQKQEKRKKKRKEDS